MSVPNYCQRSRLPHIATSQITGAALRPPLLLNLFLLYFYGLVTNTGFGAPVGFTQVLDVPGSVNRSNAIPESKPSDGQRKPLGSSLVNLTPSRPASLLMVSTAALCSVPEFVV